MIGRHALLRCLGFLALLALLRVGSVLGPREASATASGCSFATSTSAPLWEDQEPDCQGRGSGCYECSYHNTGDNGYTICSEEPDGSGPANGKPLCDSVAEIPPDWPPPSADITDPDPGQPPPDAPAPDTGDDGNPGDGGPGGGPCDGAFGDDCADGIVIREMSQQVPPVTLPLVPNPSMSVAAPPTHR